VEEVGEGEGGSGERGGDDDGISIGLVVSGGEDGDGASGLEVDILVLEVEGEVERVGS